VCSALVHQLSHSFALHDFSFFVHLPHRHCLPHPHPCAKRKNHNIGKKIKIKMKEVSGDIVRFSETHCPHNKLQGYVPVCSFNTTAGAAPGSIYPGTVPSGSASSRMRSLLIPLSLTTTSSPRVWDFTLYSTSKVTRNKVVCGIGVSCLASIRPLYHSSSA